MKKWISVIIIFSIIFCMQSLDAQTWSKTKILTDNAGDSEAPAITVDSNENIHVVWQNNYPGNYEIYYRKSTNGGTTWSTSKRLTHNQGNSCDPSIAVDSNGKIYVVWRNYIPSQDEIYWINSPDNGTTWAPTKRLSWNPGNSSWPDIEIDSKDHVYVVWNENTAAGSQLLFKKSTDGGTSWYSRQLTWNNNLSLYPKIMIDSSDIIHVVWEDYSFFPGPPEICYKKSVCSGSSWSATKKISWGGTVPSFTPKIASDKNNRIRVVWYKGYIGGEEIYYERRTDGGGIWTTKPLTWTEETLMRPAVAVAPNNNIYVVWQDDKLGAMNINFKIGTR